MNNELPIVVKPSRWRWGVLALGSAVGVVVGVLSLTLGWNQGDTNWEIFGFYAVMAVGVFVALLAVRECIIAAPRMIIDEDGVGGRLVMGGRLVGKKRIAWKDIRGARFSISGSYLSGGQDRIITLEVDNAGSEYRFAYMWMPFLSGRQTSFLFPVTNSKLSDKQAEEIAAIINNLVKTTLAERQKMTKSPFATDE